MVECSGLENRRGATHRGFESLLLRHLQYKTSHPLKNQFFFCYDFEKCDVVFLQSTYDGQVGEWFNPVAWNAAVGQLTGGSNPPLSAIKQSNSIQ